MSEVNFETISAVSGGNPGLIGQIRSVLQDPTTDRRQLQEDLAYLKEIGVTGQLLAHALLDIKSNYLQYLEKQPEGYVNPFEKMTIHEMTDHFRTRDTVYLDHLNRLLVGQHKAPFELPELTGVNFSSASLNVLPDKVTELPIGTVIQIPDKNVAGVVIGLATEEFKVQNSMVPEIILFGQTVNAGILIYAGEGNEGVFQPLSQQFYDHKREYFQLPKDASEKSQEMLRAALGQIAAGTAKYAYEEVYSITPMPTYLTDPGKAAIREAITMALQQN